MLQLAVEQAKIEDQIFNDYGIPFNLFIKACNAYGYMKTGSNNDASSENDHSSLNRNRVTNELSRDA